MELTAKTAVGSETKMPGHTILVVDDDEEVRDMMVEYLGQRGFTVIAADGSAAMRAALARNPVDLVILDRTMPCGDGLRLVPELQRGHQVRVIVVTALGQDDDRILGLETGADDYIAKPFNMRELGARIDTVLRRAASADRQHPAGDDDAPRLSRRRAAILCADVAGYVRLMRADEEDTLRSWWMHRHTIIDPAVRAHGGRLVKFTGDGFLAEFPATDAAVHCALAIQVGVERANARLPDDRRMHFRIGINFSSIVADREDIYGDGVNLAARLQAEAEPGGICLSEAAYAALSDGNGPGGGLNIEETAARRLKNIDEPVRIFCVRAPAALAP